MRLLRWCYQHGSNFFSCMKNKLSLCRLCSTSLHKPAAEVYGPHTHTHSHGHTGTHTHKDSQLISVHCSRTERNVHLKPRSSLTAEKSWQSNCFTETSLTRDLQLCLVIPFYFGGYALCVTTQASREVAWGTFRERVLLISEHCQFCFPCAALF